MAITHHWIERHFEFVAQGGRFSDEKKEKLIMNWRTPSGNSILHVSPHPSVIRRAVTKYGLSIHEKNFRGQTPLMMNTSLVAFRELIKLGADVNAKDFADATPCYCKDRMSILLKHPDFQLASSQNNREDKSETYRRWVEMILSNSCSSQSILKFMNLNQDTLYLRSNEAIHFVPFSHPLVMRHVVECGFKTEDVPIGVLNDWLSVETPTEDHLDLARYLVSLNRNPDSIVYLLTKTRHASMTRIVVEEVIRRGNRVRFVAPHVLAKGIVYAFDVCRDCQLIHSLLDHLAAIGCLDFSWTTMPVVVHTDVLPRSSDQLALWRRLDKEWKISLMMGFQLLHDAKSQEFILYGSRIPLRCVEDSHGIVRDIQRAEQLRIQMHIACSKAIEERFLFREIFSYSDPVVRLDGR